MTKEEKEALLEEAKRKYPIGCTPRCLTGGSTGAITKHSHHSFENGWYAEKEQIWFAFQNTGVLIYSDNKWAEIISYPENYKKPEEELIFQLF